MLQTQSFFMGNNGTFGKKRKKKVLSNEKLIYKSL